jgi:hypothetical protein
MAIRALRRLAALGMALGTCGGPGAAHAATIHPGTRTGPPPPSSVGKVPAGGAASADTHGTCGTRYVDPAGSDSNPPPSDACRHPASACRTLQRAIDVACPGDVIQIGSGVYAEQLKVTKSGLTLNGAPTDVVIRPSAVVPGTDQGSPCSGGIGTAIVLVSNASGVTLNNLNVDGSLVAASRPPRFIGISYRNASGAISGGSVTNIRHEPLDGAQNGLGIHVQASATHVAIVDTSGVTVSGYQKNGITYSGCGCANAVAGSTRGVVSGNTVTGAGPTSLIAQNGIQVGFGAGPVTISGNHVSGAEYTGDPSDGTGTGILLFSTTNNVVLGNIVETSNTGVDMEGGAFGLCDLQDTVDNLVTCNLIAGNGAGVVTNAAANSIQSNTIVGNGVGVDATLFGSGTLDVQNNWWGCTTGPNTRTCDTANGRADTAPFAVAAPACVRCSPSATFAACAPATRVAAVTGGPDAGPITHGLAIRQGRCRERLRDQLPQDSLPGVLARR